MKIACPHCGQHIAADDSWVGMTVTCPNCGQDFQLAAAPAPVAEATESPASTAPPPPPADPSAATGASRLTLQRHPAGGPPPIPPATATPPAGSAGPGTQGAPPSASQPNAAPAQLPSKAADTIAYAILFVPAFLTWRTIGGIGGLFVAALIIFLFRGALAGLLQSIGGMFGGPKPGRPKAGSFKADNLKELLPAAGAMFVVLLLLLWMWKPWSVKEQLTYAKNIRGKGCTVTVLDAKGQPVVEELVIFIDERARHSMKKDIPGKGRLEVYFAGFELTGVIFNGERLKEKGSGHYTYTAQVTGTNATLTLHDADGKVVRTIMAVGVAAPPGPANVTTRSFNQTETNTILAVTSAGRGMLEEKVKRPTITGHLEEVLLVEAEFDRGKPVRVTYQGKPLKPRE